MSETPIYEMALRASTASDETFVPDFSAALPTGWEPSEINPAYMERQVGVVEDNLDAVRAFVIEQSVTHGVSKEAGRTRVFRVGSTEPAYVVDHDGSECTAKVVAEPVEFRQFVDMGYERRCITVEHLVGINAVLEAGQSVRLVDIVDHQSADDMVAMLAGLDWSYGTRMFDERVADCVHEHRALVKSMSALKTPIDDSEQVDPATLVDMVARKCAAMPLDDDRDLRDIADTVEINSGLAYCTRLEIKDARDHVKEHGIDDAIIGHDANLDLVEDVLKQTLRTKRMPAGAVVVELPKELKRCDLTMNVSSGEMDFGSRLVVLLKRDVVLTGSSASPNMFRSHLYDPNVPNCHVIDWTGRDTFGEAARTAVAIEQDDLDKPLAVEHIMALAQQRKLNPRLEQVAEMKAFAERALDDVAELPNVDDVLKRRIQRDLVWCKMMEHYDKSQVHQRHNDRSRQRDDRGERS